MNNISKYFDKSPKKPDLSGESNPEEERKKVREGSSKTKNADDTIDDEVFQLTNSTSDISEILVSLRKLGAKVAEVYNLCNETKSMHIKGGSKQLAELMESVQHMSDKFDDFAKDRKEKEEIINNLKEEVSTLKGRVETLEKKSDGQEQYLRRNCILVHGLEENKDEITDDLVASFIKDKMVIDLSVNDIDGSHRIGKPSPQKRRPIIVKFVRYNNRT